METRREKPRAMQQVKSQTRIEGPRQMKCILKLIPEFHLVQGHIHRRQEQVRSKLEHGVLKPTRTRGTRPTGWGESEALEGRIVKPTIAGKAQGHSAVSSKVVHPMQAMPRMVPMVNRHIYVITPIRESSFVVVLGPPPSLQAPMLIVRVSLQCPRRIRMQPPRTSRPKPLRRQGASHPIGHLDP